MKVLLPDREWGGSLDRVPGPVSAMRWLWEEKEGLLSWAFGFLPAICQHQRGYYDTGDD